MRKWGDGFPARALVTSLVLLWATAIGLAASSLRAPTAQSNGASASRAAREVASATALQENGFVGDETCTTCHESEGRSLRATLHGKAQNARTPAGKTAGQACETCHRPRQAHVETGEKTALQRFTPMSAKDVNGTRPSCHTQRG